MLGRVLKPEHRTLNTKIKTIISFHLSDHEAILSSVIEIDPITRIEGHLGIRVVIEGNRVTDAFVSGEMFRGFEAILAGRDPLDAQQIVQRICGVCPVSHGMASVLAQEEAYGVASPENGRLARNIMLAANFIQSHIIHFYHLSAPDFIDMAALAEYTGNDPALGQFKTWLETRMASKTLYPAAPFLPRYEGDYVQDADLNVTAIKHYLDALDIRALAHKLGAIYGGKLPHVATLVPGGVTEKVTAKNIVACKSILGKIRRFIDTAYIPDAIEVASALPEYYKLGKGPGNHLAFGVFSESAGKDTNLFPAGVVVDGKLSRHDEQKITEDVAYSLYSEKSGHRLLSGRTIAEPDKNGAYSWIKAPRYGGEVMEAGPVARMIVALMTGGPVKNTVGDFLRKCGVSAEALNSVMGRHLARAVECKIVADRCADWVEQLYPGSPVFTDFKVPITGKGRGLTEAPRGALGHWLEIGNKKIRHYQCVVPSTWNCSPRDGRGQPGAIEQALIGTPVADEKNPVEAVRVVRSFDPCIACAVH